MGKQWMVLSLFIGFIFFLADVSQANAEDSNNEFTLEEITVTAQKRAENQQKVAIAMDVITGDGIRELGKHNIDEILNNVASVMIQSNTDGLRVSIRGMSNDNNPFGNLQNSTPTVAVNTDGIPTNRNSSNQNLFDIERVEVLYGPQSTMYASSTPGGIVNVVTADPKTDKYEASGTLEYGNYNLLHTEGAMNAPVNDKMALRAAFTTSIHDGYLTNGSNDQDSKSARLKTLFKPSDKFSIMVAGEYTTSGGQGFSTAKAFINQDDKYYPDGTALKNPWTSSSGNAGLNRKNSRKKLSGRMDWDLGYAGSLSIIPSYLTTTSSSSGTTSGTMSFDSNVTYLATQQGHGYEKNVEARMASSADFSFKWFLGANIYKTMDNQQSMQDNQTDLNAATQYATRWNSQSTKAIYGNITYPVTSNFRATVGARKSWDKNTTYNHEIPGKGSAAETIEGSKMKYDKPNFKVGFEYDLASNSMLYGDWSSSYRMNGSGITPGGKSFPPEELMAYTLGAKNRFFGNKLQLNASAYYYDYSNYFAVMGGMRVPKDLNGDGIWEPAVETATEEVVNINTGDAKIYGFDLQTTTIITDNDKLNLSVSYIKKYFTNLIFDFPFQVNDWFGIPDLNYSGKDMPQAPNWNITANYTHNFILGNGGILTAGIDVRYTSRYVLNWMAKTLTLSMVNIGTQAHPIYTGAYNASITDTSNVRWQEAYHLEDLSLVYASPDGKWNLTAYVKNLEDYAVKRSGGTTLQLGDPRTYGAVVSVKF
jgi:iron complex outermembrane recepter protein